MRWAEEAEVVANECFEEEKKVFDVLRRIRKSRRFYFLK